MPNRLSVVVLTLSLAVVAVEVSLAWVAPSTSLTGFVSLLLISFCAGAVPTGRVRIVSLATLVTGTLILSGAAQRAGSSTEGAASSVLTPTVLVLGPALAGGLVGRARRQATELRRLTAELAAEREARVAAAATEERNRIARELHDVISHSVSQMVMQAGAAEQLLGVDAPARTALQAIRVTGCQALTELREQLGVLREAPDEGPAPVPALGDVRGLTDGVLLEYDAVAVGHVPAGLALAAYRVVQEALTNARRHADGAPVRVRICREEDLLTVDVVNGPGHRHADVSLPGAGHGLTGMRERVDLYAGELETHGTADGGWWVRALLPLGVSA